MSSEINLLLLDEPGNNLDIPTLDYFRGLRNSFPGIVVTVSHDRYFLDNVVDRIFAFEGDGHLGSMKAVIRIIWKPEERGEAIIETPEKVKKDM